MFNDNELRVRDLHVDNKGLFYYINEINPDILPIELDINTLDLGFQMLHGNKKLIPFIENMYNDDLESTLQFLATMIISSYGDKWIKLINIYKEELNADTYKLETTEQVDETGNISSTKEDVSESERVNKVSAYDVEDYSNDGMETKIDNNTAIDSGTSSNLKNVTKTVKGSIGNRLNDIMKIQEMLQSNVINDIIYTDVSSLVGLKIY